MESSSTLLKGVAAPAPTSRPLPPIPTAIKRDPKHRGRPRSLSFHEDHPSPYRTLAEHKLVATRPRSISIHDFRAAMNYSNYADSPGGGGGGGPVNFRQAPPSPSQGMNHSNGMNGGGTGMAGMAGYPTPAGHQSDLNYVMSLVEELSQTLRVNQQLTASVVEKMGKVREKAQSLNLTNDEILSEVARELNEDTKNLETENSELRRALEKSEHNKKENYKLACHGAGILADILEKMHRFKEQHESDTLAWHKSYRNQLAVEREENLALRNQIMDMKAAASRANGHLRDLRRYLTDHDELHELRVQNVQFRQERRFWKRKALPLIPDDDSEWSDDDDIIDPVEKMRLAAVQAEKERKEREEPEGGEAMVQ